MMKGKSKGKVTMSCDGSRVDRSAQSRSVSRVVGNAVFGNSVKRENFQGWVKGKRNFSPLTMRVADLITQVLVVHVKIAVMSGKGDEKSALVFDDPAHTIFGF